MPRCETAGVVPRRPYFTVLATKGEFGNASGLEHGILRCWVSYDERTGLNQHSHHNPRLEVVKGSQHTRTYYLLLSRSCWLALGAMASVSQGPHVCAWIELRLGGPGRFGVTTLICVHPSPATISAVKACARLRRYPPAGRVEVRAVVGHIRGARTVGSGYDPRGLMCALLCPVFP